MSRKEKESFVIRAVWEIEEGIVPISYFDNMTDEELDKEVEWYDYLLGK